MGKETVLRRQKRTDVDTILLSPSVLNADVFSRAATELLGGGSRAPNVSESQRLVATLALPP